MELYAPFTQHVPMAGALRSTAVALAAALVVASVALAGAAPTAEAAGDRFVLLTTSTTPEQPTTSGEFTFTTTFRSAGQSGEDVTVERIEIREGTGSDATVLAERGYFGESSPTLAPGATLDQDFSLEFDEPGTRELSVRVTFGSGGQQFSATYRTNVTVYEPNPGLQVDAQPTTAGERTAVTVDVANGLDGAIRDVELALDGAAVDFDEPSRIASGVASGATRTFVFNGTPESLGTHPIEATLSYTTAGGTRRHVTRSLDVRFRSPDLEGDVGLAADVAPAMPGADTTLNLTLSNGLDRAIRQLEVSVSADGATVKQPRRVGTGLASGAQRTFRFGVSRSEPGRQPVDVTVSFTTVDGIEGEVTETLRTTFDAPANPGEIRLTGVDAVERAGRLEVSATASNVGASPVSSVVVSIGDAPSVAPADYFVGSVDASDFASFTLATGVTGNVSSVPLEVTYVVGGVERSLTTTVPVAQAAAPQPGGNAGGGLPLLPAAAVLVVVAGAALAYRRWG